MRFADIRIRNFKSIRDMEIGEIDSALILVGKNNTGKTSVLDAIRAVTGSYTVSEKDFNEKGQNIEIDVVLEITEEDRQILHRQGAVSQYKRYELWEQEFCRRLPSFSMETNQMAFTHTAHRDGTVRRMDGIHKNNPYISEVLPEIRYVNAKRDVKKLQNDLLLFQEDIWLNQLREGRCMFSTSKDCRHCFQCIGLINQKSPDELNIFETEKLLEFKLYQLNLNDLSRRMNDNFYKNGGYDQICYTLKCDVDEMFHVSVDTYSQERDIYSPVDQMGKGMKSIYLLSLLETYVEDDTKLPSIIVVEYPETFLHPQLQKTASEILYRLSKKNQVMFSTHSPNLLVNFNRRQIKQVVLDENWEPAVRRQTDIDVILNDLGYAATDFMNVDFVFIVEGKQDKSRLPLLLQKYYSEVYDEEGRLSRISIITTNSCTNIKTYANLKYMNQVYLKDQFLMIRDGDGKNPEDLARQLCKYYDDRSLEDADKLPRVTRKNVLILKYYSFENYFFNPSVMAKLGIVKSEEAFYTTLWNKWREYLYRLKSGRQLTEVIGHDFQSKEDLREHMEEVKTYLRGHNLYDIFYGPYKKNETALLKKYIDLAPKEDFKDILDAVDRFLYFDSRKKKEEKF